MLSIVPIVACLRGLVETIFAALYSIGLSYLSDAINAYMNAFLSRLFSLADDADRDVQRELCRSLSLLIDTHTELLEPQLPNIVQFMLIRSQASTSLHFKSSFFATGYRRVNGARGN